MKQSGEGWRHQVGSLPAIPLAARKKQERRSDDEETNDMLMINKV